MSPPVQLDLHVHSTWSVDGRSSVAEHAARLASLSLQGFALTDHNSTQGHAELRDLRSKYPQLLLVPGVEISTRDGHLLAYGIDRPAPTGQSIAESLAWVAAQGGEAVVAHPFRWPHGAGPRLGPAGSLRALEAVNGHNLRSANARAQALAERLAVPTTGGSDGHAAGEVGRAFPVVPAGCANVDDLLEAIRRGKVRGEGASLQRSQWLRWGVRAGLARIGRGLRSV